MDPSSTPAWVPVSKPLSAYPLPQACCLRAHEEGYRRGYRHGYWYALWDVGEALRLPARLWQHLETFVWTTLDAWVHRGCWREGQPLSREHAPRFPGGRVGK